VEKVIEGKSYYIFSYMDRLFDQGKTAWVVVTGMSMYPFLRENLDMVELTRASFPSIKKGDIVLIQRLNGEFVLHRVMKKNPSNLYIIGDAQQWLEGPILENQLKAIVINIRRDNKMISCNNRLLNALVCLWFIARPIRNRLIQIIRYVGH
jgi:hypothetical protein